MSAGQALRGAPQRQNHGRHRRADQSDARRRQRLNPARPDDSDGHRSAARLVRELRRNDGSLHRFVQHYIPEGSRRRQPELPHPDIPERDGRFFGAYHPNVVQRRGDRNEHRAARADYRGEGESRARAAAAHGDARPDACPDAHGDARPEVGATGRSAAPEAAASARRVERVRLAAKRRADGHRLASGGAGAPRLGVFRQAAEARAFHPSK